MATRRGGSRKSPERADDALWMRRAVALAERALGRTSPNPAVGAVLVKAGRIVGEGWTRPAGGPHAEVVALRRAGARARGATLYVTFEPCAHFGRTPPCADAVVAAGVARVVVGVGDPNPRVRGRGLRTLERAGVAVTTGVLAAEAGRMSAWFRHWVVRRRPFVILKLAASLDGRIATAAGASRWITGAAARRWVHELRNRVDAVMVGSETVLADDPALTCRRHGGRDPLRIVIDGRLRMPLAARLVRQRSAAATVVATTAAAPLRKRRALGAAGVEVIVLPAVAGKVDLAACMRLLAARGVVSLLVEGGGELAAALLRARLVDRLALLTAPVLLGGDGRPMLGALRLRRLGDAPRLVRPTLVSLGPDVLREGPVAY